MGKVVYSACYGGFGLSDAAIRRYAEIKGIPLFPEKDRFGFTTWWTVPEGERSGKTLADDEWHRRTQEERIASNKYHQDNTITDRDIPRDDPALVQVVEELGERANGEFAKLCVDELAPGTRYRIDEYDGFESIEAADGIDWQVAR